MAVTPSTTTVRGDKPVPTPEDLEADIARLREDIAALTKQLQVTGEHTYSAAKRAATTGVEQLKAQGDAAVRTARASAEDLEAEIVERVREKPITALALAAGVGFLFALISRR